MSSKLQYLPKSNKLDPSLPVADPPTRPEWTVFILGESSSSLSLLLAKAGLPACIYDTIDAFLDCYDSSWTGCAIVCAQHVNTHVLKVLDLCSYEPASLPLIVVCEDGHSSQCAQAFRAGAFDFFEQSQIDSDLFIQRVRSAVELNATTRGRDASLSDATTKLDRLTPRELQVVRCLVGGKSLKQIAAEFGVSIQTTSRHRLSILEKLDVHNDVEIVTTLWPIKDKLCA
ncbi:MAG: LuxR C-terminal-related transcriptional regulator [Pirellulales bacterium]|nr:LuxR C-terminal-related transcriptional regulator [Pirellulales bacterium]